MSDDIQNVDETIKVLDSLKQKLLDNKDHIDFSRRLFKIASKYHDKISHDVIAGSASLVGYVLKHGLLKECMCADADIEIS